MVNILQACLFYTSMSGEKVRMTTATGSNSPALIVFNSQ